MSPLDPHTRLAPIRCLEPELAALADGALAERSRRLRARVREGGEPGASLLSDELSDALPDVLVAEGFALVREAARRVLGLRPFDVQLTGGLVLYHGGVAEMQTGEGKTLTAVAPVYLHALAGRGAHVLTFNDYLARRDAGWMGPVYELLGLTVGCVQEGMAAAERRRAYARDVTYVTAREAGFDLLRDGLCLEPAEQVHRPFHFALVDEADSILIDEARIPLVIAGEMEGAAPGIARLADLARRLRAGRDFDRDEQGHSLFLTEAGAARLEAELACGSLFTPTNVDLLASLRDALHARHLLRRDVDYIVRDGKVELVDELTGRVAERRHWPDGLQAAVEAKEGLRLGAGGRIFGAVTLQHFLRLYPRLAGMTATARPAAAELAEIYGLEVVTLPPHRPCIRRDEPDLLLATREARDRAVVAEIARSHARGRPVLVGTVSVAESERLAARLAEAGVPCRVLNAKNDEAEAAIVAEAGRLGAVTISTNMAGRGTDIRLGGGEEEREAVLALGGLYVLGTHRHASLRIDRQLRGRAGRQGDPGSSRFFVSLEDELLQRYGITGLLPKKLRPEEARIEPAAIESAPIDSTVVHREVERVQRIAEGEGFDQRRRLYEYSEILERQRRYVAEWRQAVLEDQAELDLLARRCPERHGELRRRLRADLLHRVERRLTLLCIDRCWARHLAEMQSLRDSIHLVALDGRSPLAEYYRRAIAAFEELLEEVDDAIVDAFRRLEITPQGVDWEREGLRGPSATWTYQMSDHFLTSNVMLGLANRASIGLWGVLLLWPVLLAWGLHQHWRRWRRKRGKGKRRQVYSPP